MLTEDPYNKIQSIVTKLCKTYKINDNSLDYESMIDALVVELDNQKYGSESVGNWRDEFQVNGTMYRTFTQKVLSLPEKLVDGFGRESLIDKHHQVMQIFRIPLNEPCTLVNLLRVACYSSLTAYSLKSDDFPEGIVKAFKGLSMTSMISYTDGENYSSVLSDMPSSVIDNVIAAMLKAVKG